MRVSSLQNINVTFDIKPLHKGMLPFLKTSLFTAEQYNIERIILRFLSDRKVASLWVFSQHFFFHLCQRAVSV